MKLRTAWKNLSVVKKIIIGVLLAVLVLLVVLGITLFAVYKSGERALKEESGTPAPRLEVSEEEVERARETLSDVAGVAWEDDWLVYDGKVYEYRENMLNFLLLGVDHMGELPSETQLSDWSAGQADAIFLVALDQDDKTISLIGIPRNSMVDLEIYNSEQECTDTLYNQICLQYGYAGGGELGLQKMTERVSELLWDLPIHGVCAINNEAIARITDSLGGIEIEVQDEDSTGFDPAFTKGSIQTLTGENVYLYLKYRDMETLGSPTARLERQKAFIKTAAERIMQEIADNPLYVKEMYEMIAPYMNTDISVDEAVYTAAQALGCTLSGQYQLTGEDKAVYYTKKNGEEDFFDDYYLDEDALNDIVIQVFYREVTVSD